MRHRGADSTTRLGRALLTIGLVIAMCCASFVTLMAVAVGADVTPTIASDQVDYPPGGAVQLTGTGWQPGESVHIVVNDTDGQTWQHDVTVVADDDGVVLDAFDLPDSFIANYDVTATGDVSGVATTTFTDLPATFDQCSNNLGTGYTSGDTGCRWTNGALQSSNSKYFEGDSTVQRVYLFGLDPDSTHTLTLEYDTTKGGKHGYDFLTTWDASENWITDADRCQDITGCTTDATESTADIPDDPNVPNTFEPTAPGARQFVMRGGTLGGTPTTPALVSGTYAGDSTTAITLSFTVGPDTGAMCETKTTGHGDTTTCDAVLWFGGHLAQQLDWGAGLGASNISGAPFHVSLAAFDDDAIGRRDNPIQGNNVGVNGSLILAKQLSGGPSGYTGPFTIHYDCGASGSGDPSVSAGSSVTVNGIPTGTVCTITETPPSPPTGYSFGTPTYTDSSGTPNDGIVTIVGAATVTVTTNNTLTRDTGSLKLAKQLSGGPSGYTGPFTIHYDCGAFGSGDPSVSAGSSVTVNGIPTGTVCTITETPPSPPMGYSFGTPTYTDSSDTPNDGIVTITNTSVVTVTTNNTLTRDTGTLTIKKTLSNPDGASVPASYTVNYNCGVGYTGSRSVSTSSPATVTGIPTGNTCTITEAALAPIAGFAWSAPTYTPASIIISSVGGSFVLTVNNAIRRDNTPPACALTQTIPGPPTQIKVTTSDSSSGIKSIVVTKAINTSVSIPVYAVGTTASIVVTGTKVNQSLASELALKVTDVAGNVTNCDPVIVNALGLTKVDIANVPTAERVVTVYNGNPGLATVTVKVNGRQFVMSSLKAGETRNIDIASALLPGDKNAISLSATGSSKGTACVVIWDGV